MRSLLSLTFTIAAGALPIFFLSCGQSKPALVHDAATTTGTGGSPIESGSTPAGLPDTGGALASGGMGGIGEIGGTVGAGGESGSGGLPRTGGAAGTGGANSTGGKTAGTGGASSTGGKTAGTGGVPATGGAAGLGGTLAGSGGATGSGGSLESGGRTGAGGATGTGGSSGSGGVTAGGGMSGSGGSSTTVAFPPRFVGSIDGGGSIRENFATQWDQFTPENAGKWASVQGASQATFNWGSLDAMYKYTEDHHILFKEHCFVWGAAQPSWQSNLDTTTGPEAVKNWMKAFCDRYPNTRLIDVVNEPPPHTTPPYAKVIGGGTNTTWDWIANSFKWAREACPNAILILNDYNNVEYATDVQRTIDVVNAIKKLGAPIDAVGCQTHEAANLPASTLKANIDNIASSTGLPVYITEYDIGLADDELQRQKYEEDFTMFWGNPNVKGVTVWGYIVGLTWRSNTGIMKSDGTMRPAMSWLMEFLGR